VIWLEERFDQFSSLSMFVYTVPSRSTYRTTKRPSRVYSLQHRPSPKLTKFEDGLCLLVAGLPISSLTREAEEKNMKCNTSKFVLLEATVKITFKSVICCVLFPLLFPTKLWLHYYFHYEEKVFKLDWVQVWFFLS